MKTREEIEQEYIEGCRAVWAAYEPKLDAISAAEDAELDALNEKRKAALAELDDPMARHEANARLIAAAPDMLKVLEQLEWDGYDYLGNPTCPACAQRQTVGHYPDCELAAAIKKAKGQ